MKFCVKCGKTKPETEFNRSVRDGIQSYCKDCSRTANREWYKNNTLHHREMGARWEKQNRDKVLQHERKYRDTHPDYDAKKNSTRRAQLLGSYTQVELEQVKLSQWFGSIRCYYCGCDIDNNYHIEHVIPIARGGSNIIDNIVLACPSCNHSKGSKLLSEWRK